MNIAELKTRFFKVIPSHPPNDWEIEEHLESMTELPENLQDLVLSQVPAIWSVSHSLCYAYLTRAGEALDCLSPEHLNQWVGDTLDIYEKKGLHAAQNFMADVEANFLCRLRGESGLNFSEAEQLLTPYARSIIERRIFLAAGPEIYTDSETVFLPKKLTICTLDQENFLLYKLIVTFQLGLLLLKTYEFKPEPEDPLVKELADLYNRGSAAEPMRLDRFFDLFPDSDLAEDIFTVCEARRISNYLNAAFPGLWRDTAKIRADLAGMRLAQNHQPQASRIVDELNRAVLMDSPPKDPGTDRLSLMTQVYRIFCRTAETAADSAEQTAAIFQLLHGLKKGYSRIPPLYYCGRLNPAEAEKARRRQRNAAREEFVQALASVLHKADQLHTEKPGSENIKPGISAGPTAEEATAMHLFTAKNQKNGQPLEKPAAVRYRILGGPAVDLPESLRNLAREIIADHGRIPEDYISAAQGLAGQGVPPAASPESGSGDSLIAPITYDEWDFRRNGFRKNWCQLLIKNVPPVRGTFINSTLDKYQGLLRQLKKQFEMLRTMERFTKRQRYGDDIDLDAMIEAIADIRAGKPFSERLFVRLQRDERDIAVLFLVDMSSSTEGWINQALKEALILMGEALNVLGDRFAIHGFSGMRRTRSDFYQVKNFAEPYNLEVKERIAAISPQEYTRMGPPLRHAIELLQKIEAKVRLLVVLSDGKPEDYDDYKGEYAIEDTRHALIEAKSAGIHPFCITIDKEAHDYIGHMYGEVNYIFVDEVRKLPVRLPEIYRVLTT